ncbi:hypothetical protein HGM15179_014037, partial [Zosterops borbonicus]
FKFSLNKNDTRTCRSNNSSERLNQQEKEKSVVNKRNLGFFHSRYSVRKRKQH